MSTKSIVLFLQGHPSSDDNGGFSDPKVKLMNARISFDYNHSEIIKRTISSKEDFSKVFEEFKDRKIELLHMDFHGDGSSIQLTDSASLNAEDLEQKWFKNVEQVILLSCYNGKEFTDKILTLGQNIKVWASTEKVYLVIQKLSKGKIKYRFCNTIDYRIDEIFEGILNRRYATTSPIEDQILQKLQEIEQTIETNPKDALKQLKKNSENFYSQNFNKVYQDMLFQKIFPKLIQKFQADNNFIEARKTLKLALKVLESHRNHQEYQKNIDTMKLAYLKIIFQKKEMDEKKSFFLKFLNFLYFIITLSFLEEDRLIDYTDLFINLSTLSNDIQGFNDFLNKLKHKISEGDIAKILKKYGKTIIYSEDSNDRFLDGYLLVLNQINDEKTKDKIIDNLLDDLIKHDKIDEARYLAKNDVSKKIYNEFLIKLFENSLKHKDYKFISKHYPQYRNIVKIYS